MPADSIDDGRRARTLVAILLACAPAAAVTGLMVLPYRNGPLSAVFLFLAAMVQVLLIVAVHRGHLRIAVPVFAASVFMVVIAQPILTGDLSTNPLLVPLGAVMLIYVLPGHRLFWASAWSLAALLVLLLGTNAEDTIDVPPYVWLLNTALVALVSIAVVLYGDRQLREAVRAQEVLTKELSARDRVLVRLREMAHTDPLTGFRNRRSLEETYAGLPRPSAVALIDIDNFKRVNDEQSHAAGDQLLSRFSSIVADTAGPDDHLYRIGGDEFLVLRRNATAPGLGLWLHGVRERVRAEPDVAFSFSAGVVDAGDQALSDVLQNVDNALYAAKGSGRDRIVVVD